VLVVVVEEITDRCDPCSNKLVKSYSTGPSPSPPSTDSGCKLLVAPSNSLLSLASSIDDVDVVDDAILAIPSSCRILFATEFCCCLR
jgi:hypothetical protein